MPSIEWLNPIPSSYDPLLQRTQWVETLPSVTAPVGKEIMVLTGDVYTWPQVQSKGATVISQYSTLEEQIAPIAATLQNTGKTVNDVPRNEHIGFTTGGGSSGNMQQQNGVWYDTGWYPGGPRSESASYEAAGGTDIGHRILIQETLEGQSWVDPSSPAWKGWLRRVRERRDELWLGRGLKQLHAFNYYTPSPFDWWTLYQSGSKSYFLNKYNRPLDQWEGSHYTHGGNLTPTNLIVDGIYMDPDTIQQGVLRTIWRALVAKKMGYDFGIYMQREFEFRPNNWNSIIYRQAEHSGNWGVIFRALKVDLPPEIHMAYTMVGLIFGVFADEWNGSGKASTDKIDRGWLANHRYFKNRYDSNGPDTGTFQYTVQTDPLITSTLANDFPYYMNPGDKYRDKNGSNYLMFGANMYCRTFGQTSGGTLQPMEWRIDGGSWHTAKPTMAEAVVDAYFDKSYFVFCERKAGKISVAAFNQSGTDMQKHNLEMKHPVTGVVYSAPVVAGSFYASTFNE